MFDDFRLYPQFGVYGYHSYATDKMHSKAGIWSSKSKSLYRRSDYRRSEE
jgi:hypothetical protein